MTAGMREILRRHAEQLHLPAQLQVGGGGLIDWFCYARIEEDFRYHQLTRFVITFRLVRGGKYRRHDEIHRLKVFSRAVVTGWLRKIGFRVRTRRAYGDFQLGPRQSVFICRKIGSSAHWA